MEYAEEGDLQSLIKN